MKKTDFMFYIQTKKELEFSFKNKSYSLYYDKSPENKDIIVFGQTFEGKSYKNVGELLNTAKIENYFLKDLLDEIEL